MKTYRVIELFSGVGSQRMALKRLEKKRPELHFEFVAQCEIDKHAINSYNAIHGETPNLGDITKVEKLPDCDILTWSFPCQDLSQAGNKKGMDKESGTRSALAWDVIRVINASEHKPEWLLMENVPAVTYRTNIDTFKELIGELEKIGYNNKYQILNAVDFDVAQNRKRCFMISHYQKGVPDFPKGPGLNHCLRDYLDKDVDPKYYLSKERLQGLIVSTQKEKKKDNGFGVEISEKREEQKRLQPERATGNTTQSLMMNLTPTGRRTYHNKVFVDPIAAPPMCASDYKDPTKILELDND